MQATGIVLVSVVVVVALVAEFYFDHRLTQCSNIMKSLCCVLFVGLVAGILFIVYAVEEDVEVAVASATSAVDVEGFAERMKSQVDQYLHGRGGG